jgi:hypothetical protein
LPVSHRQSDPPMPAALGFIPIRYLETVT